MSSTSEDLTASKFIARSNDSEEGDLSKSMFLKQSNDSCDDEYCEISGNIKCDTECQLGTSCYNEIANKPEDNYCDVNVGIKCDPECQLGTSCCNEIANKPGDIDLMVDFLDSFNGRSSSQYIYVNMEEAKKALNMFLQKYTDIYSNKESLSVSHIIGDIIHLKRNSPSQCEICNKKHENEKNPYIAVTGNNKTCFFYCRRSSESRGLIIGDLIDEDKDINKKEDINSNKKPIDLNNVDQEKLKFYVEHKAFALGYTLDEYLRIDTEFEITIQSQRPAIYDTCKLINFPENIELIEELLDGYADIEIEKRFGTILKMDYRKKLYVDVYKYHFKNMFRKVIEECKKEEKLEIDSKDIEQEDINSNKKEDTGTKKKSIDLNNVDQKKLKFYVEHKVFALGYTLDEYLRIDSDIEQELQSQYSIIYDNYSTIDFPENIELYQNALDECVDIEIAKRFDIALKMNDRMSLHVDLYKYHFKKQIHKAMKQKKKEKNTDNKDEKDGKEKPNLIFEFKDGSFTTEIDLKTYLEMDLEISTRINDNYEEIYNMFKHMNIPKDVSTRDKIIEEVIDISLDQYFMEPHMMNKPKIYLEISKKYIRILINRIIERKEREEEKDILTKTDIKIKDEEEKSNLKFEIKDTSSDSENITSSKNINTSAENITNSGFVKRSHNGQLIDKQFETGQLHVTFGPMKSGKSSAAIAYANRMAVLGLKTIYVRYGKDTRTSDKIKSYHDEGGVVLRSDIDVIKSEMIQEIYSKLMEYTVIVIDEGQFFGDITIVENLILKEKKLVYISSLDADVYLNKFGKVHEIIHLCEPGNLTKVFALCVDCAAIDHRSVNAGFTYRLEDKVGETFQIGAKQYIPVCLKHHQIRSTERDRLNQLKLH